MTICEKVAIRDEEENFHKHAFFRRKNFKDVMTGLVFSKCKSYVENKRAYHNAIMAISRGECKNMFEAHAIYG